jgi:hypothetical protein
MQTRASKALDKIRTIAFLFAAEYRASGKVEAKLVNLLSSIYSLYPTAQSF